MALFKGAGVALVTPMHEDGTVNFEVLESIIEEQILGDTDAIISVGTTGEAATLTEEEHIEVIAHTVKVVNHRIPVIAGTGSNCTDSAIYLSKKAEEVGADGLLWLHRITIKQPKMDFISILKQLRSLYPFPPFSTMFREEQA